MNKKLKRLNILLAGALCAAAIGTGVGLALDTHYTMAESYTPTSVFTKSGATIAASETDAEKLAFTFTKDTDTVSYNRTLAWKWHESASAAEYLSFKFELDGNFSEFSVTFETASLTATEHDKITNKLTFKPDASGLKVELFPRDESEVGKTFTYAVSNDIQVKLSEGSNAGEFTVNVTVDSTTEEVGVIGNVGSNYAEYVSGENGKTPLSFSAKLLENSESASCYFKELNKQSFALTDGKIEDNAAPVLTLNDDEITLALGETFSLETKTVDVLDKNPKSSITYYQWAPVDTEAKYVDLTSGTTRFYDKKYTDGEEKKSVYSTYTNPLDGRTKTEYVSIKYTLTDTTHTKDATEDDKKAAECMLAWYMKPNVMKPNVYSMPFAAGSTESPVACLVVEEDKTAPKYTGGEKPDPLSLSYEEKYQVEVTEKTKNMEAGESETFYLPSPEKLFDDNSTGYKSLKYTLCYKTPSNSSGLSSSNQSVSNLKLTVSSVGTYRFKLFVTDRAGNVMKSKKSGEPNSETITTDNIWEHDELPTFTFKINKCKPISLDNKTASSRSDSGLINVTYSDISFNVKGTPGTSEYGLYFFDLEYFNEKYNYRLATDDLSEITTDALSSASTIKEAAKAYAKALAVKLDASGSEITADTFLNKDDNGRSVLREIGEYKENVNDENYPDNQYQWKPNEKSFLPTERGNYIVFGVFTDSNLLTSVAGYKAIDVSDKEDINPGESDWLKNNLVSVILFSIAGVMFILIIVLLFVKPSDETLEDVGAETASKGKKSTKSRKE